MNARSPGASSRRASVRSRPARLEKGRRWGSTAPVEGPSAAVWRMEKNLLGYGISPHAVDLLHFCLTVHAQLACERMPTRAFWVV